MLYKNYEIVFKPELNKYAIIDTEYDQQIICNSIQACKIRISKLINTRIYLNNLK
jgi:hypothetical protein